MKNNKKNILIIIIISVLVVFLVLKDNFSEKVHYLFSINPVYLILSFSLIITYWILKGIALYYCVNQIEKKYTRKKSIKLMITTQLFHAITPFATGGQPWQIYRLKKEGIPLSKSTNIIIEDFITYQIALVLLGITAVISNHFFNILPKDSTLGYLVTIGFLINTIVVILLFVVSFNKKCNKIIIKGTVSILEKIKIIKDKQKIINKSDEYIKNFHDSAKILLKNKFLLLKIIGINFIALTILYLIPFTIMLGLNIYINPIYVICTSAYVMLIDSVIPTPGSTGGLEYGFMSFFKNFVKDPQLSIIMIVWRIVTYYFGIFIGLIFLNTYKEEKTWE